MKHIIILLLLFALPGSLQAAGGFDFSNYQQLLDRYLVTDQSIRQVPANALDYHRFKEEQQRPGSPYLQLLADLAAFNPSSLEQRDERLAFWINVYNLAAIKTILDNYPVDSIRSRTIHWLGRPWRRKVIKVGEHLYSLRELEQDVLISGFRDLRVFLAINTAATSSPDLRAEPYQGDILDRQLREQGERLTGQPEKGLLINRANRRVRVSQIFKFNRDHFDAWHGGAEHFLSAYVDSPTDRELLESGSFELDYLDFEWRLNDLKWASRR